MVLVPHQVFDGPEITVEATIRDRLPDGRPLYVYRERFYIRSRFIGEVTQEWYYTNNERLSQVRSFAFFCQLCGDIWARRITTPSYWQPDRRLCEKHGGGSLLLSGEADVLDDWPLALITYEFIIATKDL